MSARHLEDTVGDHLDRKHLALSIPVFAVELATAFNLFGYYRYHELPLAALLLAVSFSALLIATAILIAQDLSTSIRALLIAGGVILFAVQAASNISEAYLRGQDLLPAGELATLWGVTPDGWLVRSSLIWGAAINVVGAIYWFALGMYYRSERRRDEVAAALLQSALEGRRASA